MSTGVEVFESFVSFKPLFNNGDKDGVLVDGVINVSLFDCDVVVGCAVSIPG